MNIGVLDLDETNDYMPGVDLKDFGESLKYVANNIAFTSFTFPSGCEPHIKLGKGENYKKVAVTARINTAGDIMALLLAIDALKHAGAEEIILYLAYVPFARQDRLMDEGEPFSLKVFAKLINDLELKQVHGYDVHSDVTAALIDNFHSHNNHAFIKEIFDEYPEFMKDVVLVCPDSGAYKKFYKLLKYLKFPVKNTITCNKIRDTTTGEIMGTEILGDTALKNKHCLIVDDICDGGATFIGIAEAINEASEGTAAVHLAVSHGIFSKGVDNLTNGGISLIFTTDSFKRTAEENKKIALIHEIKFIKGN